MSERKQAASTVMPVVVLVAICAVTSALLGVVHGITAPIAEANAAQKAQETYEQLMPEAASFEEVPCDVDGCTAALRALDENGIPIGTIIVAQSKGYGGQVSIAVAFAMTGTVSNITAMPNDETPGLGTKIANDSYIGQYVGLAPDPITADDIDLISGATISSKAALAAFNIAVEAYGEVC